MNKQFEQARLQLGVGDFRGRWPDSVTYVSREEVVGEIPGDNYCQDTDDRKLNPLAKIRIDEYRSGSQQREDQPRDGTVSGQRNEYRKNERANDEVD